MSGLGEGATGAGGAGALPQFTPGYGGQVAQKDIDQYDFIAVDSPSTSNTWFGTANGGTAAAGPAITQLNQLADWPRNIQYSVAGVAGGTFGGTFVANLIDQFGSAVTETVVVASAVAGGSVYGTAIAAKFLSGTFTSQGSSGGSTGTAQVGFGTVSNGGSQSNWFGLMSKIAGTSDVKMLTWISTNTVTTLNKGTSIGTLVGYQANGSLPSSAFQGTSGVATTDHYRVIFKPTFDNTSKGTMSAM